MASFAVVLLILYFNTGVAHNKGYTTAATQISQNPIWKATQTDKLKQDLLMGYDKFARPSQHYNKTTVRLGLSIFHFEIDEFKYTFNVNAWIQLLWTDEKLQWNTSQYDGLKSVNFAEHEIWQPDIMLYNSASSTPLNHLGTHCVVDNLGHIIWVPPVQLVAFCELNLRYWPFDTQSCFLKFGSWTYDGTEIDLQAADAYLDLTDLNINNSEWSIIETNVMRHERFYACCDEPYIDVTFKFSLERISPSYKTIIITPALAIMMLTLLSFWLPPQSGEKIIINACTTIIISIMMLYFTQRIPAMGSHTALIILFYSSCMYITCFSMLESVVVIWISRTQHEHYLPWYIKRNLIGNFGKWLGLDNHTPKATVNIQRSTAEEMRSNQQIAEFDDQNSDEHQFIKPQSSKPNQEDWILLAVAIDRISFILYTILFVILYIVYSV